MSVTTIPERIVLLPKFLESLSRQTIKPDAIYLQIPRISRKGKPYDINKIKKMIEKYPKANFQLNIVDNDEGPITKLYPVLDLERDDDTNIILVDEDVIYDPKLVETLLNNRHLGAVGFAGRSFWPNPFYNLLLFKSGAWRITQVDFLETYHGVLYKRHNFPATSKIFLDWIHHLKNPKSIFTDDIVIGAWLSQKRQPRYIVPLNGIRIEHDASGLPELRNSNLWDRNMDVYKSLYDDGYFHDSESHNPGSNYWILIILIIIIIFYILFKVKY